MSTWNNYKIKFSHYIAQNDINITFLNGKRDISHACERFANFIFKLNKKIIVKKEIYYF